jgi:hypothetical protein
MWDYTVFVSLSSNYITGILNDHSHSFTYLTIFMQCYQKPAGAAFAGQSPPFPVPRLSMLHIGGLQLGEG